MYTHILIATDGSALAAKAVNAGLSLATQVGAKVTALTVTEPFHTLSFVPSQITDTPETFEQHAAEFAHRILEEVQAQATTAGVLCDTAWVQHEHPYEAIIDGAKSKACDLIVMASHGRSGVSAIVLGSQTLKVLTHSTLPVLVYR
jgi:nucleotide-binding universal stress UspA family protein